MPPGKTRLLFVAHPDDETLFFASVLFRYRRSLHLVVVTDGDAMGERDRRRAQFAAAMKRFEIDSFEFWDEPDHYETRLSVARIMQKIRSMRPDAWAGRPRLRGVYTHGPLGEYGHPHHQDVSRAVHEIFWGQCPVWSPAYNVEPDSLYRLTRRQLAQKREILADVYRSETRRFLNLIPATAAEGFVEMGLSEVRALHDFFAVDAPLEGSTLERSHWLRSVLPDIRQRMKTQSF
jgi:LmbE family N-acetylglucosaminyl deacetylase